MLEICFLAIPMLTGRKTVQKEGFGPKCGFFLKSGWWQRVGRDLTIRKWRRPWKQVTQLLESIEVRLELKEGDVSEFRENKYILSVCHSRFQVIWTLHNVVVQGRQRNVQNVKSCCFPHKKKKKILSCFRRSRYRHGYCKVPNDVDSGAICSKNGLKFDNFLHKKNVCLLLLFCLLSLFSFLTSF